MGENNKVLLGVLGGVLLGAFGAAVVKRGNLRPHAAKVLTTLRMQSLSRLKRSKKHVKI